jgi:hypothetical protein
MSSAANGASVHSHCLRPLGSVKPAAWCPTDLRCFQKEYSMSASTPKNSDSAITMKRLCTCRVSWAMGVTGCGKLQRISANATSGPSANAAPSADFFKSFILSSYYFFEPNPGLTAFS